TAGGCPPSRPAPPASGASRRRARALRPTGEPYRPWSWAGRAELGDPWARRDDPHLPVGEVHDNRGIALDQDDPPEAVLVVGHQVIQFIPLDGRILGRGL